MKFVSKLFIAVVLLLPCISAFADYYTPIYISDGSFDKIKLIEVARKYNLVKVVFEGNSSRSVEIHGRVLKDEQNNSLFTFQTKLDTGEINDLIFKNKTVANEFERNLKDAFTGSGQIFAGDAFIKNPVVVAYIVENVNKEDVNKKDTTKSRFYVKYERLIK